MSIQNMQFHGKLSTNAVNIQTKFMNFRNASILRSSPAQPVGQPSPPTLLSHAHYISPLTVLLSKLFSICQTFERFSRFWVKTFRFIDNLTKFYNLFFNSYSPLVFEWMQKSNLLEIKSRRTPRIPCDTQGCYPLNNVGFMIIAKLRVIVMVRL